MRKAEYSNRPVKNGKKTLKILIQNDYLCVDESEFVISNEVILKKTMMCVPSEKISSAQFQFHLSKMLPGFRQLGET